MVRWLTSMFGLVWHHNITFAHILDHPKRGLQVLSGGTEGAQFWQIEKLSIVPIDHVHNERDDHTALLCGTVTSNSKWAVGGEGVDLVIW